MLRKYLHRSLASYCRPQIRNGAMYRLLCVVSGTLLGVFLFVVLVGINSGRDLVRENSSDNNSGELTYNLKSSWGNYLPIQNDISVLLEKKNQLSPRNLDLYPTLAEDHILVVLYVHNRPHYLQLVVSSLSQVLGINETLLIVSHDGYFEGMNKIVEGIKFCQVKQIFAPYSPHIILDNFPGAFPSDCKDKDDPIKKQCEGNSHQYGNHRSPKFASLKHHWWWMMNTVWDGLKETHGHSGHILFIEEDHYIFPNAYRNLQLLAKLKLTKCPHCYAANLAPCDVKSRGEGWDSLIVERIGNVGYAFNRTVWRKIHSKGRESCSFDDYNWDITMSAAVYPSFGSPVYSLRGPWASAVHFGKCGPHQGQGEKAACIDNGAAKVVVEDADKVVNIKSDWGVRVHMSRDGYQAGFRGLGDRGDKRDHQLCLEFSKMHHFRSPTSS